MSQYAVEPQDTLTKTLVSVTSSGANVAIAGQYRRFKVFAPSADIHVSFIRAALITDHFIEAGKSETLYYDKGAEKIYVRTVTGTTTVYVSPVLLKRVF